MTNCVNCGAPLESELNTCPYCGTSYFDMSSLDLSDCNPIILKFKYNNMIITQLVRPQLGNISFTNESTTCYGGLDNTKLMTFYNEPEVTTNLSFIALPFKNKLMTIEYNK